MHHVVLCAHVFRPEHCREVVLFCHHQLHHVVRECFRR